MPNPLHYDKLLGSPEWLATSGIMESQMNEWEMNQGNSKNSLGVRCCQWSECYWFLQTYNKADQLYWFSLLVIQIGGIPSLQLNDLILFPSGRGWRKLSVPYWAGTENDTLHRLWTEMKSEFHTIKLKTTKCCIRLFMV